MSARLDALRRDARRDLAVALLAVLAAGVALTLLAGFGIGHAPKALAAMAVGAALVWRALPGSHPHARFGGANRITLARLATGCLLLALVGEPRSADETVIWSVIVIATIAAVADAFDGPLARRSGLTSPFGARFDMETDAAFTLMLCALVVQFDKAGPWILAAGLMRYAFVLASRPWPWLAAPLPPSWRRKTICVVQITALIVCLGPVIPRAVSAALAAITLAALSASFLVDIVWLARHRPRSTAPILREETSR